MSGVWPTGNGFSVAASRIRLASRDCEATSGGSGPSDLTASAIIPIRALPEAENPVAVATATTSRAGATKMRWP